MVRYWDFLLNLKAAPRFELGIGVLQTPALPLGDAAVFNRLQIIAKVNHSQQHFF